MTQLITLPDDVSDAVRKTLRRLVAELGEPFSFEALKGYIERWRDKKLRIEEDSMDPGMTGYAIALKDCDFIATRRGLTRTQKRVTQLHEMAHFLKGDMPRYTHDENTAPYKKFIRNRDRHKQVKSRKRFFDTYDDEIEHDAENLARILTQIIFIHEQNDTYVLSDLLGR